MHKNPNPRAARNSEMGEKQNSDKGEIASDTAAFIENKRRTKRVMSPSKYKIQESTTTSAQEERMLKLALRNSMLDIKNSISSLDDIETMKTYYPTCEQFKNPLVYIESLY